MIAKIYRHAKEEGWLAPQSVVLDVFAGVSLGAMDAVKAGCHWVGIELEPVFRDIGAG